MGNHNAIHVIYEFVINYELTPTSFQLTLLPNPLHGEDAPAPDIYFHASIVSIRANLTEPRSNKERSVEVDSPTCIWAGVFSL